MFSSYTDAKTALSFLQSVLCFLRIASVSHTLRRSISIINSGLGKIWGWSVASLLKEGWGPWMMEPDLLCSPARLLGWVTFSDLYNTVRTLSIFVLDGRHKSLEGPKMSLLTKLAFVAWVQCPHYALFLVGSCRQMNCIDFGDTENPSPRLACRSQCCGRRCSYRHWILLP